MDPISTVLSYKIIGLVLVSVGLFIASTVTEIVTKNALLRLEEKVDLFINTIAETRKVISDAINKFDNVIKALDEITSMTKELIENVDRNNQTISERLNNNKYTMDGVVVAGINEIKDTTKQLDKQNVLLGGTMNNILEGTRDMLRGIYKVLNSK